MRSPKILKLMLILPAYPILYYAWIQQIKNTWVLTFIIIKIDLKRYQRPSS
jgi:hypothetical protein